MSHLNNGFEAGETVQINNNNAKDSKASPEIVLSGFSLRTEEKKGGISWQLSWSNLSCTVDQVLWNNSKKKTITKKILNGLTGQVSTGTMLAVVSSNGLSRSTLIQCLAGRKTKNVTGDIYISQLDEEKGRITPNISFLGKNQSLNGLLTVKESLEMATKLRNQNSKCRDQKADQKNGFYQHQLLKHFHLNHCLNTRVSDCSPEEIQKLSLALELVSYPDVLIIDDPTFGLDANSAYKCIKSLRLLTESNSSFKVPIIIASLNQSTNSIINLFHNLYILSPDGQCIYDGKISEFMDYISNFGLMCPQHANPSDFLLEISDNSKDVSVMSMIKTVKNNQEARKGEEIIRTKLKIHHIVNENINKSQPIIHQIIPLTKRIFLTTFRNPVTSWIRVIQFVIFALLMTYIFNYKIGKDRCCIGDLFKLPEANQTVEYLQRFARRADNSAVLFFTLIFVTLASMIPVVLAFPYEMPTIIQEKKNGWYSLFNYYVAQQIADSPFQIASSLLFCGLFYPLSGQPMIYWRFLLFWTIIYAVTIMGTSIGFIAATLMMEWPSSATVISILFCVPLFSVGGFFIRESVVSWIWTPLWYISYIRYAFENLLIAIYGFKRCDSNIINFINPLSWFGTIKDVFGTEDAACLLDNYIENGTVFDDFLENCDLDTNTITGIIRDYFGLDKFDLEGFLEKHNGSFILTYFEITDADFYTNLLILVIIIAVLKIIHLIAFLWKVNRNCVMA